MRESLYVAASMGVRLHPDRQSIGLAGNGTLHREDADSSECVRPTSR